MTPVQQPPPPRKNRARQPGKNGIYSVGDVAKLCGVAGRTVSKWIDTGLLAGYRIPGSLHRRVLLEDLLEFLVGAGMGHVLILLPTARRRASGRAER